MNNLLSTQPNRPRKPLLPNAVNASCSASEHRLRSLPPQRLMHVIYSLLFLCDLADGQMTEASQQLHQSGLLRNATKRSFSLAVAQMRAYTRWMNRVYDKDSASLANAAERIENHMASSRTLLYYAIKQSLDDERMGSSFAVAHLLLASAIVRCYLQLKEKYKCQLLHEANYRFTNMDYPEIDHLAHYLDQTIETIRPGIYQRSEETGRFRQALAQFSSRIEDSEFVCRVVTEELDFGTE